MHPAVRTQHDANQDTYTLAGGLDCADSKDLARQEFKDEADVNILLKRFGVDSFQAKQPLFGDTDYDIDLQQALAAIQAAKEVYRGLTPELKKLYPNWRSMLNAANSGHLKQEMDKLQQEAKHSSNEAELTSQLDRENQLDKRRKAAARAAQLAKEESQTDSPVPPPKA